MRILIILTSALLSCTQVDNASENSVTEQKSIMGSIDTIEVDSIELGSNSTKINVEKEPVIGGVFVHSSIDSTASKFDIGTFPFIALRIEKVFGDTIILTYRIGPEPVVRASFVKKGLNYYKTIDLMVFSPFGKERSRDVSLTLQSDSIYEIHLLSQDSIKGYKYYRTYISKIPAVLDNEHNNGNYEYNRFMLFRSRELYWADE